MICQNIVYLIDCVNFVLEMLYVMPVDKTKGCLPSPDDLKGKIIIKVM